MTKDTEKTGLKNLKELIKKREAPSLDIRYFDQSGNRHEKTVATGEVFDGNGKKDIMKIELKDSDIGALEMNLAGNPTNQSFDASSVGFSKINNSGLSLNIGNDPTFYTSFDSNNIVTFANVINPDGSLFDKSPRNVAIRAEEYFKNQGYDKASHAQEIEFFVYRVRTEKVTELEVQGTKIDGFRSLVENNLVLNLSNKYYGKVSSGSWEKMFREDIMLDLLKRGVPVEGYIQEVSRYQGEVIYKASSLLKSADYIEVIKDALFSKAKLLTKSDPEYSYFVTVSSKPLLAVNGSGGHFNGSLWKDGKNIFDGPNEDIGTPIDTLRKMHPDEEDIDIHSRNVGLSREGLYYIGGIMKHALSLQAIINPTVESYLRLVPGFEAPIYNGYDLENRSTMIRIAATNNPKAKRVEVRNADLNGSPHLMAPAIHLAGLDGIKNKIDPGAPMVGNVYEQKLPKEKMLHTGINGIFDALESLKEDHKYLTTSGVFTEAGIDSLINETKQNAQRDIKRLQDMGDKRFLSEKYKIPHPSQTSMNKFL